MANTRILIFVWPNFQFVLSIAIEYGGSCGNSANINLAIKSLSSLYSAIKRCIRRSEESLPQPFSKPQASFSKQTTWTLHRAQINKLMNLIRAKFKLLPKCWTKTEVKSLLLCETLEFFVFIITNWESAIKIQNFKVFTK